MDNSTTTNIIPPIAALVRAQGLRYTDRRVTLDFGPERRATFPMLPGWWMFWSTLAALCAAEARGETDLGASEAADLRAVLDGIRHPEDPPKLFLELGERVRVLVDRFGDLPDWWTEIGDLHLGRPDAILTLPDGLILPDTTGVIPHADKAFWDTLSEIGAEGKRAADLSGKAPGRFWEPAEGAPIVALGAVDVGDGKAPVRVQGPDPATCRAFRWLMLAVYREQQDRLRRWPHPVLTAETSEYVATLENGRINRKDGHLVVVDHRGVSVGAFPGLPEGTAERLLEAPGIFQRLPFRRMVRAFVRETWEQRVSGKNPYTRLQYGSLNRLAEAIGINPVDRAVVGMLPDMLRAGQEYRGSRLDLPPLWMAHVPEVLPRGRHSSIMTVDIGIGLCPGYIPKTEGRARWLLPVLDMPEFRMLADKARWSYAEGFQTAILLELRQSAASGEVVDGYLVLTEGQLKRAADMAGIHWKEACILLSGAGGYSGWRSEIGPSENGGPWLLSGGGERVRLACEAAHGVLMDAADLSARNRNKWKNRGR